MPGARDHERRPRSNDLGGLAQNHLHVTRIALVARELDRTHRRLDVGQPDDTSLDFRHGLLGDHHDVAGLQPTCPPAGIGQQETEVVARLELGNALEADHAHLRGHVSRGL